MPNTEEEMASVQDSRAPVDHALYQCVQSKKKYSQLSKDILEKKKLLDWATQTSLNDQTIKLITARGGVLNRVGVMYGNNRLSPSQAPVMNQGDWVEDETPSNRSTTHQYTNSNHTNNTQYPNVTPFANDSQTSSPYVSEHIFTPPGTNNLNYVVPGARSSEEGSEEVEDENGEASYNTGIPSVYKQRSFSSWK